MSGLSETGSRVPPDVGASCREHEELHGIAQSDRVPVRQVHVDWNTWKQAMDEPLELEIGPRQGRGFAVHALGPDITMEAETVPGPATPDALSNDMEIVTTEEAVPEPPAAPKAVGTTLAGYPAPTPPPRFWGVRRKEGGFHLLFPSNTPPGSADPKP